MRDEKRLGAKRCRGAQQIARHLSAGFDDRRAWFSFSDEGTNCALNAFTAFGPVK